MISCNIPESWKWLFMNENWPQKSELWILEGKISRIARRRHSIARLLDAFSLSIVFSFDFQEHQWQAGHLSIWSRPAYWPSLQTTKVLSGSTYFLSLCKKCTVTWESRIDWNYGWLSDWILEDSTDYWWIQMITLIGKKQNKISCSLNVGHCSSELK